MLYEFLSTVSSTTPFLVLIFLPLYIYSKTDRDVSTYILGVGMAFTFVYILKFLFQVPRPEGALVETFSPRFPSAHAALGFAPLGFFQKTGYRVMFLLYGLTVSYSRVYLKVHRPVDVVVGGIIGFLVLYLIVREEKKFSNFIQDLFG